MASKESNSTPKTPTAGVPKQKLAPAVASQKPSNSPTSPTNPPLGRQNDSQGHRSSDVDASKFSQHHTLGIGANQASPGNHTHDGINSQLLSYFSDPANIVSWTPGWFSTATAPVLGNGTIGGYYVRLGFLCFFTVRLTIGSTSTVGTGSWFFGIPFSPHVGYYSINGTISNGGFRFPCVGHVHGGEDTLIRIDPSSGKTEGNNSPSLPSTGWKSAWATNDFVEFSGFYIIDLARSPL